jgi:hypothetical protein
VTFIEIPPTAKPGEPVTIRWTVRNDSGTLATGNWSDAVYLSKTASWQIGDPFLGRAVFTGTLLPNETYTSTLNTVMPPVSPGAYRVIVRANSQRQLYEGPDGILNNSTPSPDTILATVDNLTLGVPLALTLSTGQTRLYQVSVPLGATLKVTLDSDAANATNEVYLRHAERRPDMTPLYQGVWPRTRWRSSVDGPAFCHWSRAFRPAPNTPARLLAKRFVSSLTSRSFWWRCQIVTTTINGNSSNGDRQPVPAESPNLNQSPIRSSTAQIPRHSVVRSPHGL